MKKYLYNYENYDSIIVLDEENILNSKCLKRDWLEYESVFCIEEDGELIVEDKTYDVKRGDFVFILRAPYKKERYEVLVISNETLYKNKLNTRVYYQNKRNEEACEHCDNVIE